MNLTSCRSCGVVLDKDRLVFPDIMTEDGIDTTKAIYVDKEFHPFVPCPVCEHPIIEHGDA